MVEKIKFGLSGDVGSFSEEAALLYVQRTGIDAELKYLLDMENVLAALNAKKIALGIFPVVNMRGGLVTMAFEAMGKYSFKLVANFWLDVQQCLLVRPPVQVNQIKQVVSHPQALAQCERYLQAHCKQASTVAWQDTAKAARDLSENKLTEFSAVIAPERAASLYGLEVAAKNIQDDHPNLTAFIVVTNIE